MLFELIATVVAGFAGAGVALLLNKLVRGRLPRWVVPVAAGCAMIATTIANEYGWYGRTVDSLPDGLEVATTVENKAFFRPWTHVYPFVTRFLAVDVAAIRTNDALPGQRIVDVYAFGRWAAPQKQSVVVDCAGGRRADITPEAQFADDGSIQGVAWRDTGPGDPIVQTSCGTG
jgi:hypothetical protein